MHAADQNAVTTAMSEVNTAIECLGSLESSWPGAKRCREILKELADMTLSRLQDGVAALPVPAPDRFVTDGTTIRSPGRHLGHHVAPSPGASALSCQPQSPSRFRASSIRQRITDACLPRPAFLTTRKRTIDDVAGTDLPHPSSLTSRKSLGVSTSMPPPPSPSSAHGPRRAESLASPGVFTYQAVEDLPSEVSTSYSFQGATASPQLTQAWSTPRSSAPALGQGNAILPSDLTALSPGAPNPFSISFGTPSTTNAPLDSAYLPAFAYPMAGDDGMRAPSPSQFDLSDLPFSGMDFLQTLGSFHDTSTAEQNEALWAQLGTSPFKLTPELPFGPIDGNTS